jgi:hypothetical protein
MHHVRWQDRRDLQRLGNLIEAPSSSSFFTLFDIAAGTTMAR